MIEPLLRTIQKEVSGERAKELLNRLVSCHRIQSSPGFREAAHICAETAKSWGLETEIHTFKADGKTSYWGCPIPREWAAFDAKLELIEPQRIKLADFSECKISLIQRSAPVQIDSVEIVILNDGLERQEYERDDVAGKLVLTRGSVERVHELAVEEFGALGIIYDGMRDVKPVRSRLDLPDAREYTSFWWRPNDKKCFGFVLTPRQGEWLRSLAVSSGGGSATRGAPGGLMARVSVDAAFRDGTMEVVSCFIPGNSLEEVVLVSHLCHPQPSANDNASGCVSVLEAMRALKSLIESGEIPSPKRGIRALLLAEMTGSIAYLANHEERLRDFVCALNIDMAGENQALCGSTLMVEAPPDACRGFSTELGSIILERVFKKENLPGGTGKLVQERIAVQPFSGGSDHVNFSDPDIGVPCPSLCQWPDKFYHTSMDTPDKVDPAMLSATAAIAACYGAFIASAGEKETKWLGLEMLAGLKQFTTKEITQRLTSALERGSTSRVELARLRQKLSYRLERIKDSLEHLRRLGMATQDVKELKEEANEWVRREFADAERNYLSFLGRSKGLSEDTPGASAKLESIFPSRVLRGPSGFGMVTRVSWSKLGKNDREGLWRLFRLHDKTPRAFLPLSWYWVNAKRSLAEIAELVEMECGVRDDALLESYYSLLEKVGLVKIRKAGPGR
jgi:aminopeptidase YwaD